MKKNLRRLKEVEIYLPHKKDAESLIHDLNVLRVKIANKILQNRMNIIYLKNRDSSYNNEILNETITRWITRFLALKLAEDSGISFTITLRDIEGCFRLSGKGVNIIQTVNGKLRTLSNVVEALMNEFERRFGSRIFMYDDCMDYLLIPDSAFFDILEFITRYSFTTENVRIIGFVYERFLEEEIVIEEKNGKIEAVLKNMQNSRGRRKTEGIYYTPQYIVDYIVENTLGEILKDKEKEIDDAVKNLDANKFVKILRDVKLLRVLDLACGCGAFLIKVLHEFRNFYKESKDKAKKILELGKKCSELQKELNDIKFPGTFALKHNIYGVDLDPWAIDIAAFTLTIQVYDELKEEENYQRVIYDNLKVGNSLISAITSESSSSRPHAGKKNTFISRDELENFKDRLAEIVKFRDLEKKIDDLRDDALKEILRENFDDIVNIYPYIKKKYRNTILVSQQKLLDEWYKRIKDEPIEKTYDVLINQTGLARMFLKEVYSEKIEKMKEKIEFVINKPLIKYFNSQRRILKSVELEEILADEEKIKKEMRFIKDMATEISKSQPPKSFNWEIEFPEVFFNRDGTLKENPGFDCIVGNPPWGRIKQFSGKNEKELLGKFWRDFYLLQYGNLNLYKLFLEQSYISLANGGYFSMIFPTSFLGENGSKFLRKEFLENTKIKKILEFPESTEVFGSENTQDVTILCYEKKSEDDYLIQIRMNISKEDINKLNRLKFLLLKKSEIKEISEEYQIPIFQNAEEEWKILKKISKIPSFKGDYNTTQVGEVGEGHLHETLDKKFLSEKPTRDLVIKGIHLDRYYVNLDSEGPQPRWVKKKEFLRKRQNASTIIDRYTAIGRNTQNRAIRPRLRFVPLSGGYILTNAIKYFIPKDKKLSTEFIIALLNSALLNWRFELFSTQNNIRNYDISSLPIIRATYYQQVPIISLVSTIIQKKKEYHSISQNIEDYINFKGTNIIELHKFLKMASDDFEVLSSLKVKTDNFDVLRIRMEGYKFILEYGIRRKVEKGKHKIEWHTAGYGKIKDKNAIEFLTKILEKEKRISKAKTKTIWQKMAEVKVLEFNEEVKHGFLKFKYAVRRARKINEDITKIDRAIDILVYDLYDLTEEEIKVVEKFVWGEKFEEMYANLPTKDEALNLVRMLEIEDYGANDI